MSTRKKMPIKCADDFYDAGNAVDWAWEAVPPHVKTKEVFVWNTPFGTYCGGAWSQWFEKNKRE